MPKGATPPKPRLALLCALLGPPLPPAFAGVLLVPRGGVSALVSPGPGAAAALSRPEAPVLEVEASLSPVFGVGDRPGPAPARPDDLGSAAGLQGTASPLEADASVPSQRAAARGQPGRQETPGGSQPAGGEGEGRQTPEDEPGPDLSGRGLLRTLELSRELARKAADSGSSPDELHREAGRLAGEGETPMPPAAIASMLRDSGLSLPMSEGGGRLMIHFEEADLVLSDVYEVRVGADGFDVRHWDAERARFGHARIAANGAARRIAEEEFRAEPRPAAPPAPASRRPPLKSAVLLGTALSLAAPVLSRTLPPESLLYSAPIALGLGLAAWLALAAGKATLAIGRVLVRGKAGTVPGAGREPGARLALTAAALALGLALGAAPLRFLGPLLEAGARVADRTAKVPVLKDIPAVQEWAQSQSNSEERLKELEADLPLWEELAPELREFRPLLRDPLFRRLLSRPEARRSLADMRTQLRAHAELQADPYAQVDLGGYERFLQSLGELLQDMDSPSMTLMLAQPSYRKYAAHVPALRRQGAAVIVAGYMRLAERAGPSYLQTARSVAETYGLPDPGAAEDSRSLPFAAAAAK